VSDRCAVPSQRIRGPVCRHRYQAMMVAQATCKDGIAETWFDRPVPSGPYTDSRCRSAVSTKPRSGSSRGGATGSTCTSRHASVVITTVIRIAG
jgi:hypothetical protein